MISTFNSAPEGRSTLTLNLLLWDSDRLHTPNVMQMDWNGTGAEPRQRFEDF